MTIVEIFSELSNHMIKGMMVHDQMSNYYRFLGLNGYAKCHEYHFMKETCGYRKLQRYFISRYNKLIPETEFNNPSIIPESWYAYTRQDVDASTIKNAVKVGLTTWVDWERDTKDLYQRLNAELYDLGEIATAKFLEEYISDVDCEHKKAQTYLLHKNAIGFDINEIVSEQHHKHKKYEKHIEKIFQKSVDK